MCYRLIYYKNGEQFSYWSDDYARIFVRSLYLYNDCCCDVEIWEYTEQGSRLLGRSIHHGR